MSDAGARLNLLNELVAALPVRAQRKLQPIIDLALEVAAPRIVQQAADSRRERYSTLLEQTSGADDAAARFKGLFGALPLEERAIMQTLVDLAVEMATPGILKQESERQRSLAERVCAGTYRFNVGPLGTVDDLHTALDDNLLRILGEFYLGDLPSDAVRAEISVALYRGDDKEAGR